MALTGSAAYAVNVTDVKVKILDGFGGDTSSVLTRCQTKPGTVYDPVTLTRDVTSLKASNEYQDITADAEATENGVTVTFSVFRKMRYQAPLVVKGNEAIGTSKITSESGLRDGTLYGEADFAAAAEKVRAFYRRKHYPQARVTAVPTVQAGSDTCEVTFIVDEGPCLKVGEWRFEGAVNAEQADLRQKIDVYPWWNPVGWFANEPATEVELAEAALKVTTYYTELGYLDATVTGPQMVPGEEGKTDYGYTVPGRLKASRAIPWRRSPS